jgi:hypothetical protein
MNETTQIAIVGEPGTGKSYALRNLDPATTFIITPNPKHLPFKGASNKYKACNKNNPNGNRAYCRLLVGEKNKKGEFISKGLVNWIEYINEKRPEIKTVIIEDITHFFHAKTMNERFMSNADWGKWNIFASDVFAGIINPELYREGLQVVHIYHSEIVERNGKQLLRILTQGKLLNRNVLPSSYYTYMVHSQCRDIDEFPNPEDQYKFLSNGDGTHDCKTPFGLFDTLYINNDVDMIFKKITEFQNSI